MTAWQVLNLTVLGALSAALWFFWDHGPHGRFSRLMSMADVWQAVKAYRQEGVLGPVQQRTLRVWLALAGAGAALFLMPFSRVGAVLIAAPILAAAAFLPALFRGHVPVWQATRLNDKLLPFFAHVYLRLQTVTLPEALSSYTRHFEGVLAREVEGVLEAFHVGVELETSFEQLAEKYDNAHLRQFAAGVREMTRSERPEEVAGHLFRDLLGRVRQERRELVKRRVVLATTVGVLLLLPAVLVLIFEPAVAMFLRNFR